MLVLLAFLVDYTLRKDVPSGGVGLILAVAIAVVGSHIDRQVNGGYTSYWDKVHDSLQAALPYARVTQKSGFPACQRTRFNTTHALIHDREGRRGAVKSILGEPTCTRKRPCKGHGGT